MEDDLLALCVYWNYEQTCLQSNYYIKIKHLEGRFDRETSQGLSEGIVKIVRSIITKYLLYWEKALKYHFLGKIFSYMMWQGLHHVCSLGAFTHYQTK